MCFNHIFFNIRTYLSQTAQWRTHLNGSSSKKRFLPVKFAFLHKKYLPQTASAQAIQTAHRHPQVKKSKYPDSWPPTSGRPFSDNLIKFYLLLDQSFPQSYSQNIQVA